MKVIFKIHWYWVILLCGYVNAQHTSSATSSIRPKQSTDQPLAFIVSVDSSGLGILSNAFNDGNDVSKVFSRLGYDTVHSRNPNYKSVIHTLDSIAELSPSKTKIVIYLTGHGLAINNEAYFLTAEARVGSARRLRHTAISITHMINMAARKNKSVSVILMADACRVEGKRNLEKKFNRGVKTDTLITDNVFIFYACNVNKNSFGNLHRRNSFFTEAFIKFANDSTALNVICRKIGIYVSDSTNRAQVPITVTNPAVDFFLGSGDRGEKSMIAGKDSLSIKGYHGFIQVSRVLLRMPIRDYSYASSTNPPFQIFSATDMQQRHNLLITDGAKKKTKPKIQKFTHHEHQSPVVPAAMYLACTGSHFEPDPVQKEIRPCGGSGSVSKNGFFKITCQ